MEEKIKIVTDILGSYRRVGNEHLYHCPYCGHHKKKMSVNFVLNAFKCWVCDTRGKNIFRIVRKFGNYDQRQKYLELQGRLDLTEFDDLFKELNDEKVEQTIELPKEFISLCNKRLPVSSQRPLSYLKSRGITKREIQLWKIGYCNEGRYSGRIIIPSFNNNGDCNYFIARSFVGHKRKYLNPPCGRDIIFNELMVDWAEPIVLVEGVFDAIVVGDNAVPILGSTLRTESKLFQALAINDAQVYMALDADARKKSNYMMQSMLKYDMEVFKVDTSFIEDIGSITTEHFDLLKDKAELVDSDLFFFNKMLDAI